MAELTASDLCVIPQCIIDSWNSYRRSSDLPFLRKNPSVSKGTVVAPRSNEELFAHNFIAIEDFRILARLAMATRNTRIWSDFHSYMFMSKTNLQNFLNAHRTKMHGIWGLYGSIFETPLFEYDESAFTMSNVPTHSSNAPFAGIKDTLYYNLNTFPEPTSINTSFSSEWYADEMVTPLNDIRIDFDHLKAGCVHMQTGIPVISSMSNVVDGVDYYEDDSTDPPTEVKIVPPPYPYTAAPINGKYERWENGGVRYWNHTTWTPQSYVFDSLNINSCFLEDSEGTRILNGGDFAEFFVVLGANKCTKTSGINPTYFNSINTFRLYQANSLGDVFTDVSDGSTWFTPDNTKMTTAINSISDSIELSCPEPSYDQDLELYTNIEYYVFSRIKPSTYSS